MRVHGKRYRGAVAALEPRKLYATREALPLRSGWL